ncbi:putative quinol monooxygenase [Yoonia sp. R2-816]|uniref:putative quinol monooxygenase n=1 Tax=Yoonia sp. R2-816 TaxID=3342638 RepID=UPI0037294C3E
MKTQILQALAALALITTSATAQDSPMDNHTASYIAMPAAEGQTKAFAKFLAGAAPIVKKTEPGTVLWFALQADDTLAIFDIFVDKDARNAHFSGAVAGALNENADVLVAGGWDDGVVANIYNSSVLSVKAPVDLYTATTATYINLEAAPGKGPELAALLTAAGPIVADTEPETLFWAALQIDENSFAIFDIFANNAGRKAHFAGQVAGLLNKKASELVSGGWDDGVVANINNFDILAIK